MNTYTLDEKGNPVAEPDILKWGRWFESAPRTVAREKVDESEVSTVFLGMDHSFSTSGPPILWETMVFGGPMDQAQDRCAGSREQAEAMHAAMVARVNLLTGRVH